MFAAGMMTLLLAFTVGAVVVGSAVIARHRAQAAADLAALSAAGSVASGREAACASASAVAVGMHATVSACTVDGLDVVVATEVPVRLGRWGVHLAHAAARAGPSDPND